MNFTKVINIGVQSGDFLTFVRFVVFEVGAEFLHTSSPRKKISFSFKKICLCQKKAVILHAFFVESIICLRKNHL